MDNVEYKKLVAKLTPKENRFKNMLMVFIAGGTVGLSGEILFNIILKLWAVNESAAMLIVTLIYIVLASIFTALGFFDNWVTKYRAGLFIPITGFAHSITSSIMDYKKDGLINGIGSHAFKMAGSVIIYAIISGFAFAILHMVIS